MYIGDAIMALFGAPISRDGDAEFVIRAALSMQTLLVNLNKEFCTHGWPELAMGIGINSTKVVAGNMGSNKRLNYTVIGDGVNLSSRVEMLTKRYQVPIIVTENTKLLAPNFIYQELDKVKVKGKNETVSIFAPLGIASSISDQQKSTLKHHEVALMAFKAQLKLMIGRIHPNVS